MVEGQNLCFKTLRCAFRPTTFKQMQLFSALSGIWWISLWTSPDVRFLGRHKRGNLHACQGGGPLEPRAKRHANED